MKSKLLFLVFLFISFFSCGNYGNNTRSDTNIETQQNASVETPQYTKVESILGKLKLKEIKCLTGFMADYAPQYTPVVVMVWENIADWSFDENTVVEGVFIDNKTGGELKKYSTNFQDSYKAPLRPGDSRQFPLIGTIFNSKVTNLADTDISCKIYVNGQLYKTVKIANRELFSDRI